MYIGANFRDDRGILCFKIYSLKKCVCELCAETCLYAYIYMYYLYIVFKYYTYLCICKVYLYFAKKYFRTSERDYFIEYIYVQYFVRIN